MLILGEFAEMDTVHPSLISLSEVEKSIPIYKRPCRTIRE